MKIKSTLLFVLVAILAGVGLTLASSGRSQGEDDRGTIAWHVRQAKRKGQKQIEIPPPIPLYAAVNGLDDALAKFNVVIAQPVEKRTYVQDRVKIVTWYKFKVLEHLSQPDAVECLTCLSDLNASDELLPLQPDEILLPTGGDRGSRWSNGGKPRQGFLTTILTGS